MARYNFQLYGDTEAFLAKLPPRKKSLVINSIIQECLKSSKIKKILSAYFTTQEIEDILYSKKEEKKEEKKVLKEKVEQENIKIEENVKNVEEDGNSIEENDDECKKFKIEI